MYTYVDANTLQVRIDICLYVSVVQANVNMAHPTPPNPNPMRDVASTSWRKCKRTSTSPHPTQPQPHAWRSINFMTQVQEQR